MSGALSRGSLLLGLAIAAGVLGAAPAAGAVDPARTSVNPTAKLGAAGRTVRVTGQVRCASCARLAIAVTISQRSGALAQGGVRCVCRAATERWTITARVRDAARLHKGRAQVCGWVTARGAKGTAIDAYQWCRVVTLS